MNFRGGLGRFERGFWVWIGCYFGRCFATHSDMEKGPFLFLTLRFVGAVLGFSMLYLPWGSAEMSTNEARVDYGDPLAMGRREPMAPRQFCEQSGPKGPYSPILTPVGDDLIKSHQRLTADLDELLDTASGLKHQMFVAAQARHIKPEVLVAYQKKLRQLQSRIQQFLEQLPGGRKSIADHYLQNYFLLTDVDFLSRGFANSRSTSFKDLAPTDTLMISPQAVRRQYPPGNRLPEGIVSLRVSTKSGKEQLQLRPSEIGRFNLLVQIAGKAMDQRTIEQRYMDLVRCRVGRALTGSHSQTEWVLNEKPQAQWLKSNLCLGSTTQDLKDLNDEESAEDRENHLRSRLIKLIGMSPDGVPFSGNLQKLRARISQSLPKDVPFGMIIAFPDIYDGFAYEFAGEEGVPKQEILDSRTEFIDFFERAARKIPGIAETSGLLNDPQVFLLLKGISSECGLAPHVSNLIKDQSKEILSSSNMDPTEKSGVAKKNEKDNPEFRMPRLQPYYYRPLNPWQTLTISPVEAQFFEGLIYLDEIMVADNVRMAIETSFEEMQKMNSKQMSEFIFQLIVQGRVNGAVDAVAKAFSKLRDDSMMSNTDLYLLVDEKLRPYLVKKVSDLLKSSDASRRISKMVQDLQHFQKSSEIIDERKKLYIADTVAAAAKARTAFETPVERIEELPYDFHVLVLALGAYQNQLSPWANRGFEILVDLEKQGMHFVAWGLLSSEIRRRFDEAPGAVCASNPPPPKAAQLTKWTAAETVARGKDCWNLRIMGDVLGLDFPTEESFSRKNMASALSMAARYLSNSSRLPFKDSELVNFKKNYREQLYRSEISASQVLIEMVQRSKPSATKEKVGKILSWFNTNEPLQLDSQELVFELAESANVDQAKPRIFEGLRISKKGIEAQIASLVAATQPSDIGTLVARTKFIDEILGSKAISDGGNALYLATLSSPIDASDLAANEMIFRDLLGYHVKLKAQMKDSAYRDDKIWDEFMMSQLNIIYGLLGLKALGWITKKVPAYGAGSIARLAQGADEILGNFSTGYFTYLNGLFLTHIPMVWARKQGYFEEEAQTRDIMRADIGRLRLLETPFQFMKLTDYFKEMERISELHFEANLDIALDGGLLALGPVINRSTNWWGKKVTPTLSRKLEVGAMRGEGAMSASYVATKATTILNLVKSDLQFLAKHSQNATRVDFLPSAAVLEARLNYIQLRALRGEVSGRVAEKAVRAHRRILDRVYQEIKSSTELQSVFERLAVKVMGPRASGRDLIEYGTKREALFELGFYR